MILTNSKETIAYIAIGPEGICIADITNKSSPSIVKIVNMDLKISNSVIMTKNEKYLFAFSSDYGFWIIDVSICANPIVLKKVITNGGEFGSFIQDEKYIN